jgi:N-acetylmuramoyl-L-alanine amidase
MNARIAVVWRQGLAILLASLAGSVAGAATDQVTTVTAVRMLETDRAQPQLLVELAAHRAARLFTLSGPDRVVLDIPAADADDALVRATLGLQPRSAALHRLRIGRQPGHVLRLVLDTRRAMTARLTTLEPEPGRGVQLLVTLDAMAADTPAGPPVAAVVPPAPARAPRRVVAIDAGHGGADLGSLGRGGTREKDVTLALARTLAGRIDATPGWRAVLTRADDSAVTPAERARRAAQAGASLFVSLQANAEANPDLAGAAVYVYDPVASSPNAAWLAEREMAEGEAPPGGLPVVPHAADSRSASLAAAEAVVKALRPAVPLQHPDVQQAPLASLRDAQLPAILVNVACLSNREDERRVRSVEYGARLAEAIAHALDDGVERGRPSGAAPPGSMWATSR